MPIDEPSLAGFTMIGSPRRVATARKSLSGASSSYRGVGTPAACQTSLVRHLSIASALARTPEPVYGIPASSSAPCNVPSSP